MPSRKMKLWVTRLSAMAGLLGLVVGVRAAWLGDPFPLWAILLVAYGGVFILVLPMNWIGQQAARLRQERDGEIEVQVEGLRPPSVDSLAERVQRPSRSLQRGRALALQAPYIRREEVRLVRVTSSTAGVFQHLVDDAIIELSALQDKVPEMDAEGHVRNHRIEPWLQQTDTYLFLIQHGDESAGICIVSVDSKRSLIPLMYVKSAWRQRGIGTVAWHNLVEFATMLAVGKPILTAVSQENARGRRFVESVGCQPTSAESLDGLGRSLVLLNADVSYQVFKVSH